MALSKAEVSKLAYNKPKRAQTLFRLWTHDRKKVLKKLIDDNISLQDLMETLCLGYLKNDPGIMRAVKEGSQKHKARSKRVYLPLDEEETFTLLQQLEQLSPLQDKEIRQK